MWSTKWRILGFNNFPWLKVFQWIWKKFLDLKLLTISLFQLLERLWHVKLHELYLAFLLIFSINSKYNPIVELASHKADKLLFAWQSYNSLGVVNICNIGYNYFSAVSKYWSCVGNQRVVITKIDYSLL